MKILRSAIQRLLYLGIDLQQPIQNHLFNHRNVLAILVLGLSTVSSAMYFFRVANTFTEYTYSIYAFSSMLLTTIVVLIVVFETPLFIKCLNSVDNALNERKPYAVLCMHLLHIHNLHKAAIKNFICESNS